MPEPTDQKLYDLVKKRVYKEIPKHSAYRSGIVVQKYKKSFKSKYGAARSPYKGKKTQKKGLKRWFAEDWRNQRGEIGYKYKNDVYRPTKRITKNTPTTFSELSKKEIKRARREKRRTKRVKNFKKQSGGGSRGGEHYGIKMKETIVSIKPSSIPEKKYMALVRNKEDKSTRLIHFGASDYEQYKDSTGVGKYTRKNHGNPRRRHNYFTRHSGIGNKKQATVREIKKSNGLYNAKIFSHIYLW